MGRVRPPPLSPVQHPSQLCFDQITAVIATVQLHRKQPSGDHLNSVCEELTDKQQQQEKLPLTGGNPEQEQAPIGGPPALHQKANDTCLFVLLTLPICVSTDRQDKETTM